MSKKELKQRETNLANSNGAVGKELEQTLTVDDSFLPSPAELQQYKDIDPKIVDLLCSMSEREQKSRHELDKLRIKTISKSESRQYRINIWGMLFAFLALLALIGVTAWALYLDKPWIAIAFGAGTITSIVSLFVVPRHNNRKQ